MYTMEYYLPPPQKRMKSYHERHVPKGYHTNFNKIIQREELVESTLPEKRAAGERAAARQCLPPGEGERPAAATCFWQAQPALERLPQRMRTWGLEKDAEL